MYETVCGPSYELGCPCNLQILKSQIIVITLMLSYNKYNRSYSMQWSCPNIWKDVFDRRCDIMRQGHTTHNLGHD